MTNVNAVVQPLFPLGGADGNGRKIGWLPVTSKVAQNDTITITNASAVNFVAVQVAASGAVEACTVATNVVTLTSATTGTSAFNGLVVYQEY